MRLITPLLLLTIITSVTNACVPLRGIDDATPHSINSSTLTDFPEAGVYLAIFKGLVSNGGTPLLAYETPIALRIPTYTQTSIYNVLAAFEPKALDIYARKSISGRRRRCIPDLQYADQRRLFSLHRRIALAYIWSTIINAFLPEAREKVYPVMYNWGLDPDLCVNASPPCDHTTPYGLAHIVRMETVDYALRDGWNADGSLSRSFNRIPYEDHRDPPYVPKNTGVKLLFPWLWQPLREHNGKGFLFEQAHVVPHIGDTAKSRLFSNEDMCARKAPDPHYRYGKEIEKLLKRSRQLTSRKKAEIILFDTKPLSIVPLVSKFFTTSGRERDDWDVRVQTTAFHLGIYEAIVAVWREKVRHDRVRPPSMLRKKRGKSPIRAYAGPNAGITVLPADEWEPYIRTMPHAEYPSASACMCKAFEQSMIENSGVNDFMKYMNSTLSITLGKGDSTVEEGFPERDITLSFNSFSEVSRVCSRSRLNGGMHFTAATREGEVLCEGIGQTAARFMRKLSVGERPEYVAPFHGAAPRGPRCT